MNLMEVGGERSSPDMTLVSPTADGGLGLCPGWRGFSMVMFGFMFLLMIGLGMAAGSEPSFCCEKIKDGGPWCQNDIQSNCDPNYIDDAPTSCESTSYCKTGTCYDSGQGLCMENTPQRVCDAEEYTWDEREIEDVPQCQLGCAIIADQAAFVTLVRAKKIATDFGVELDYRTDITNEIDCISAAQSQDVGACVYEKEFERLCEFTTRGECGASEEVEVGEEEVILKAGKTFYKDYLCSAEELSTSCAKETTTSCDSGDVYWMDSCGNRENVYSSDKDKSWNSGRVQHNSSKICDAHDGSSEDNCGNCDYLQGSRCSEDDSLLRGNSDGDYYCKATECVDREDNVRDNGESWCFMDDGAGDNSGDKVGSRYFREVCDDGAVRVEPCGDYRNEICIEGWVNIGSGDDADTEDLDDFGTAACRVNRWQDCLLQTELSDCNNTDQRDCRWIAPVVGIQINDADVDTDNGGSSEDSFSNPTGSVIAPITGKFIFSNEETDSAASTNRKDGICVPASPPGLMFWEEEGSSEAICGQASAKCVVILSAKFFQQETEGVLGNAVGGLGRALTGTTGKDTIEDLEEELDNEDYDGAYRICKDDLEGENCECLLEDWADSVNNVCTALGDCGWDDNYVGDTTSDGYSWTFDGDKRSLS